MANEAESLRAWRVSHECDRTKLRVFEVCDLVDGCCGVKLQVSGVSAAVGEEDLGIAGIEDQVVDGIERRARLADDRNDDILLEVDVAQVAFGRANDAFSVLIVHLKCGDTSILAFQSDAIVRVSGREDLACDSAVPDEITLRAGKNHLSALHVDVAHLFLFPYERRLSAFNELVLVGIKANESSVACAE